MNWFQRMVCGWFHGGGRIKRNPADNIDWQCTKCGRWYLYKEGDKYEGGE